MSSSLPPVQIYGTWSDFVVVTAIDDELPADLTAVTEVILRLVDPWSGFDELTLRMTEGDIYIDPEIGLIEWSVELGAMRTLRSKLYHMILLVEESETGATIPLVDGPISMTDHGGVLL